MRKLYLAALLICMSCMINTTFGQANVLNPNDPDVIFTSGNQPALPTWGVMSKWGHTNRLSWNPYSYGYKSYYFKGMAFRLKFPKTYQHNVADGKTYPAIMFFHGLGEPGPVYDNEFHLVHGGQYHAQRVNDGTFDGFMIYPQSQGGYLQSYFPVMKDLMDSLVKYVKLDIDRLHIGGLSSGGQAVWEFPEQQQYAKIACAIEPISAASYGYVNYFASHITIPVFVANGGQDVAPYPSTVTDVINSYKNLGGDIIQGFYPEQGHGAWNSFWNDPRYWPFINAQHKANPLVYFQHDEFCPNETVNAKLGLQAGFYAYEWQKDGVTIAGATTNILNVNSYGSYTARFKRTATGAWSVWSPKPAVIAQNQGTVSPTIQINGLWSNVLPAPDGKTTVPLMVPANYFTYEWRRVSDNALVSTASTYNAPIGQYKIKVTEQFGCGSDFSSIYTVTAANGTNVPDAASSVSAIAISNSSIQVDWNDNPSPANNETGFEIYRSLATGNGYKLIAITGADILSFLDQGLSANTKYYYIVRAVNNNGASPVSPEVNAVTLFDVNPPTAPANLVATNSTRSSVSLSWDASTDDVGVVKYEVYVNGVKKYVTSATTFTVNGLTALTTYSFFVKALDAKGNTSPPSNQISASAALRGLSYKYFEGSWDLLPDFAPLPIIAAGTKPNVDITPRLRNDDFGFLWEGYIKIPANGTYTFETYSDDGSKLYFGDYSHTAVALVNNDGLHGSVYASGSKTLTAGIYKIAITFFEKGGGEEMKVFWGCPAAGIPNRTQIPNSAFVDDVVIAPSLLPAKPANFVVTASAYNRVNLSWTDNSNNESAFEISRATSFLGVYSTVGAVAANVTTFVDSVNLDPVTKYWYRLKAVNQYGQSEVLAIQHGGWSFDNNFNDASGNNRNLTSAGSPTFNAADKKEGTHAISFNGSSQYLNVPFGGSAGNFPNNVYNARTIAVWIKPAAAAISGSNKFVYEFGGSDNGIALRFNSGSLQAGIAAGSSRATAVVNTITSNADWVSGGWNHVAVVYDVNRLRLFVNGVLKTTTNLSFSSVPTTTNASRIASSTGTNAFNSSQSSTNFTGLMDDLEIYSEPLGADQIISLMNQSYTADTTFALPAIPAAPSNLVSPAQTTTTIALQFNDNSSNETQFELYRSALNTNNYRLLSTINAGAGATKAFIDSNLFANTNYYYKVRAKGVGGNSSYTTDVLVRTKNNVPQLSNIPNFTMRFASQKTISLSATDVDQESLTLSFADPLPAFASYSSTGNGTGNLVFNPSATDLGNYTISAIASDGNNGKDTVTFNLIVNNNYTPVIAALNNVTIGESSNTNVALSATDQDGNAGLVWSLGSAPSFVTITDNGNGNGSLSIAPGFTHAGVYPVTVMVADANGANETATFTLTVTNVEPPVDKWYLSMKYNSANAPAPWNNINTATTNNLKDGNGATTSVGISFIGTSWNAGDAGAVTGNNSGVYPDAVIKDYFWFGVYGAPETINTNITGLNPAAQYNVTLFGSSAWTGLGNNGTTIYTINGVQKPLYVDKNNQNTVTFTSITPNASGIITVNMSKGAATPYGVLNAIVLEKPFNDGTSPALPTNLTGAALPDGTVKIDWNDVAYNESGYRVSRATNAAGPFTVLNPSAANANTTSYIDNTVLSSTTYFYKVEAVNAVGSSGFSNVAEVSTTNKAPLLASIADIYVKATTNTVVNIAASDDAGDVMTVSVTGLPSFGVYQNTGNGAGNISFNPTINDIGIYNGIIVNVTDNSGASVTRVFNVTVTDNSVRSAYLNFGPEGTPQAAPWNNFLGYPFANTVYNNIKDDGNVVTGFTFKFLTQWNGGLTLGMRTGNNSGIFPDDVMKTSFHNYNSGNHTIQFGGLNPAKRYSIGFLTNRNSGAVSNVTFTNGSQTKTVDASYNTNSLVNLNGLVPTAGGTIDVVISKAAANTILLLNAVVIREYNAADPVIKPADLFAESVLETGKIKLTWSDRSSDETAFQVWRSTSFNGTYAQVGANLAANITTYIDATVAANTRYYYKVRAVKSATFSTYSNVANTTVADGIVLLNQNVNAPQNQATPWNNTNSPSTPGATFSNLINTTLINTGFEMLITKEFNGAGYAGVNAAGVLPANVMVSNYWTDAGQTSQVKFQNLDISRKYRIGCFGSNLNNDYATANYTANGKTVELNSYYNSTKIVYLDRLIPGENGEIIVSVNTAGGSPYSFTGAFTIEYYDDASPAEPVINTIYPDGLPSGQNRLAARGLPAPDNGKTKDATITKVEATIAAEPVISVYPNPFIDVIKVDLTSGKAAAVNITVHDLNGKLVFRSNNMNIMKGNNVISAHLPVGLKVLPGAYVVNIWLDGKMTKVVKLVKVN